MQIRNFIIIIIIAILIFLWLLADPCRRIVNGIIAISQIQSHILLLLPEIDANRATYIDRGCQIQIDAAETAGSLAKALGLGRGRSRLDLWKVPREQGLCGQKTRGDTRAVDARDKKRGVRAEKLGAEKSERNESRRRSKVKWKPNFYARFTAS